MPQLGFVISEDQASFVPVRSIFAVINAFYAAKHAARSDPRFLVAIALLLDFIMAYDTVSRCFIIWVLQNYEFPPSFVKCVTAMHQGTTSRYLVNDFLSTRRPVTSGIGQDCPLAPLLFVALLDPLYRLV